MEAAAAFFRVGLEVEETEGMPPIGGNSRYPLIGWKVYQHIDGPRPKICGGGGHHGGGRPSGSCGDRGICDLGPTEKENFLIK